MQMYVNTRLDAINFVMSCIGLAPVDSEDEYNLDVAQAGGVIDKASRSIQTNKGIGWWFNREKNWKMAPDPVTGQVLLPNTALSTYRYDEYNRQVKIATRGRALFDTNQHRFDMRPLATDGYIRLMIITQLEFDDLPQTAKDAVASAAAVMFARGNEMDINRIKVLGQEADIAMFALECEETTQSKNNAFSDNRRMASFEAQAGGFNNIIP